MAKLIAFEGADRVGKATQSKMMVETLKGLGFRAVRVEIPEKNFLHKHIYVMLKNGFARKHPYIFQMVQALNKLTFQLFSLPRLERDNDYVILDRWFPSAWVYGLADGLNKFYVEALLKLGRRADYTVILQGRPQVDEMRDDYEKDSDLQSRVRKLYEDYHELNLQDTVLVQANRTRKEVHEQIVASLSQEGIIRRFS